MSVKYRRTVCNDDKRYPTFSAAQEHLFIEHGVEQVDTVVTDIEIRIPLQ